MVAAGLRLGRGGGKALGFVVGNGGDREDGGWPRKKNGIRMKRKTKEKEKIK